MLGIQDCYFLFKGGEHPLKGGDHPLKGGDHALKGGDHALKGGDHALKDGEHALNYGWWSLCNLPCRTHLYSNNKLTKNKALWWKIFNFLIKVNFQCLVIYLL